MRFSVRTAKGDTRHEERSRYYGDICIAHCFKTIIIVFTIEVTNVPGADSCAMRKDRLACHRLVLDQNDAARTPHTKVLESPPLRHGWQPPRYPRRPAPADRVG